MSATGSRQQQLKEHQIQEESEGLEDSISNAGSKLLKLSCRSRKSSSIARSSGRSRPSSRASSISAAKAAAKRTALEADTANLDKFETLQKGELGVQMRKKALDLQTGNQKGAS